jgi:alpha-L-fucosidase 2
MRRPRLLFLLLAVCLCNAAAWAQDRNSLWYRTPARKWTEALPIGNGRIAAMVFGRTGRERIQLNEESVWAGAPVDDINPAARENLPGIQRLLFEGRNREAYEMTKKHMLGTPPRIRSYQTLGDLTIDFHDSATQADHYTRKLDLANAIHRVIFTRKGIRYEMESFVSAPDDMLVVRIRSSGGAFSVTVGLNRSRDAITRYDPDGRITMAGQIRDTAEPSLKGPAGDHLRFTAMAEVVSRDGKMESTADGVVLTGCTEAVIRLTAATDHDAALLAFNRSIDPAARCMEILSRSRMRPYDAIWRSHITEYVSGFDRFSIDLGNNPNTVLPTDERLRLFREGSNDADLAALYVQYGRYLLLSSSRSPARLPANLQGKWNHHFDAPWESDYHTNINLQMNYWPADVLHVEGAYEPLARFMKALLPMGRRCADSMYGARGWAMHHVTDIYGRIGINADPIWGTSPLAGAWMALSLYDHYDFTRDSVYLMQYAFPLMRESADFIRTFLVRSPGGYLVTAPSMSPENGFYLPGDTSFRHVVTYGPAMDIQIIRELFAAVRAVQPVTRMPASWIDSLTEVEKFLPPTLVNRHGGIQEWIADYEEQEPGHRHMSQLFGLYPGTSLTRDTALLTAARRTIDRRLANGGGHTGWSRAWMVSFMARLRDGEEAYRHFSLLLTKSTLPNLFDDHPPFQIDGNFGGAAGVAEMLLQSHNGVVHLLPALPKAWPDGLVKGLRARGGVTVTLEWAQGRLLKAILLSERDQKVTVVHEGKVQEIPLLKGVGYLLRG